MFYDPDAFIWMDDPSWFREIQDDDEIGYELTDTAPEKARKSFERFKLFSQLTCEDAFNPSPAYEAYQAYVAKEDGKTE